MESNSAIEGAKALPYGSYATLLSALEHFKAVGIPNIIDRNALSPSLSGSSRYETLAMLRFFLLIDREGRPNTFLLENLLDEGKRKEAVIALLKQHYQGLFDLPLSSAGPTEVNKWFNENTTPSTVSRAKAFFIQAAKANGIVMHSLVLKGARAASSVGGKRKKRSKTRPEAAVDTEPSRERDPLIPLQANLDSVLLDKLLAKFPEFDPSWSGEVQQKWFDSFSRLQEQLKQ